MAINIYGVLWACGMYVFWHAFFPPSLPIMTGIADAPMNLSGEMRQEVVGEPPSPSDVSYGKNHSGYLRLRKGTALPLSGANTTTKGYPSAAEAGGLHPQTDSMSSLHLSLHVVDSSMNNRTFLKDPLQESGSHLSHELPRSPYINDHSHPVNSERTPSISHLAPGTYSRNASASRVTVSTSRSLARSVAGSESRQAAYRIHDPREGSVHSRPVSIRSSIADQSHHGSPSMVSARVDLPGQAVPVSDTGIDHHVHYTAPPRDGSDEEPGSEVMLYDGPPITAMVANEVRRYERCNPR